MKIPLGSLFGPTLCAMLMLTGAPPPALGIDDIAGAKKKYKEGFALFEDEQYPAALSAFEESYQRHPNPDVLFNIAMCQKAMYRYTDALETFERFLDTTDLEEDDLLYLEVEAERADLMTKVGQLEIVSSQKGAALRLDGQVVGETPVDPIPVTVGEHTVELEKEGFALYRREVTLTAGATLQIQVTLEPEQGTVEIRCPISAQLVLNGQQEEPCPFIGKLPVGSHQLVLTVPGATPVERTFVLNAQERVLLDLSFANAGMQLDSNGNAVPSKKTSFHPAMLSAGVVAATLGVGAGALGGFFVVQGNNAYDLQDHHQREERRRWTDYSQQTRCTECAELGADSRT
jgi:tetratricopeptide (TPR) repeat protein